MWPSWENWISWQAVIGLVVAMGLAMIGSFPRNFKWYCYLAALAFVGLYSGALYDDQRTKPSR
jgi:hypothetical membrane protein